MMPTDVALLFPASWLLVVVIVGIGATMAALIWLCWRQLARWEPLSAYDREQRALAAFRTHLGAGRGQNGVRLMGHGPPSSRP